jgi:CRISPR/Cas system Type II protein with McrA/HNH and RuvC-like nuclease domain
MIEEFKNKGVVREDKKIPYDWTIYYLRKKALSQEIEKEELAWILLNFNQKRGYYQLRGEEEEENPNKLVEYYSLKIVDVIRVFEEVFHLKINALYTKRGKVFDRCTDTTPFIDSLRRSYNRMLDARLA